MPGGYESQDFVRALARVAGPVVEELPYPIIALTHQPSIPIHPSTGDVDGLATNRMPFI